MGVSLDNTIRVQCAAEGEIFRFTALSSLKYSSISASCRLEKTKNLPPLRSKIFAENARRWPRGAQSKTYRGILRTVQQSGRGGHSRKNALYPDCIAYALIFTASAVISSLALPEYASSAFASSPLANDSASSWQLFSKYSFIPS